MAKGKARTGRIWTCMRDDRAVADPDLPAPRPNERTGFVHIEPTTFLGERLRGPDVADTAGGVEAGKSGRSASLGPNFGTGRLTPSRRSPK